MVAAQQHSSTAGGAQPPPQALYNLPVPNSSPDGHVPNIKTQPLTARIADSSTALNKPDDLEAEATFVKTPQEERPSGILHQVQFIIQRRAPTTD